MFRLLRGEASAKSDSEEETINRKSFNMKSIPLKKSSLVEHEMKSRATRASKKKKQDQDENVIPQNKKSNATGNNQLKSLKSRPLKHDSPVLRDRTNERLSSSPKIEKVSKPELKTKNFITPEIQISKDKPSSDEMKLTQNKLIEKEKINLTTERVLRTRSGKLSVEKNHGNYLEETNKKMEPEEANKKVASVNTSVDDLVKEKETGCLVEKNKQSDPEKETKVDVPLPRKKKFFTSKPSERSEIKKSVKEPVRKRKIVKKKVLDDSSFNLPASAENVCQNEKKTLRPRQNIKNYCDESKLALSPTIGNCSVVIDRLPDENAIKIPIWKTIKFSESKNKGKDVYDISDSDLSFEEHPKKKKRGIKKTVKRLKKTVQFAKTVKKRPVKVQQPSEGILKRKNDPKLLPRVQPKVELTSQVQQKSNLIPSVQVNLKKQTPAETILTPEIESNIVLQVNPNPELIAQIHQKPKVVSVTVLDNENKVNFIPSPKPEPPKEFRPFRVTQNFHPRSTIHHNMSDHSLLSQTMSPIVKSANNVDFSTPWRVPQIDTFSRVRSLVQSTPQNKAPSGLWPRRNTVLDKQKMNNIVDRMSENVERVSKEARINENLNPVKSVTEQSSICEIPLVTSPIGASVEDSFPEDVEDKENAAPNSQSPQKSPIKNKLVTPIFEPQPGPSGLQKQPLRELKVLRQTNLNDFLSLVDTPEKTEILTPHGIFNDVHSTPINAKYLKKTSQQDIQNAFGFDDSDDEVDASPIACEVEKPKPIQKGILREKRENPQLCQKSRSRNPVRFSAKEILRTLHERRVKKEQSDKKNVNKANQGKKCEAKVTEELVKGNQVVKEHVEIVNKDQNTEHVNNLSDTFDLSEDQLNQKDETNKDYSIVPLFKDIEPPTHFAVPARSTYKRKREHKFSYSEESEGDENSNMVKEKKQKKRKRPNKADKELKEWAKNVNKTFEEIDNFDLLIE